MKKKKITAVLLGIVVICMTFFVSFETYASAVDEEQSSLIVNSTHSSCFSATKPLYVESDIPDPINVYAIDSEIERTYNIISIYDASGFSVNVTANNVNLLSPAEILVTDIDTPTFSLTFSAIQYGVGTIEVKIESLDDSENVLATKSFIIWMIVDENGLYVGTNGGEALYTFYANYCSEHDLDMLENCNALNQLRPADPVSEGYVEYPEVSTYSYDPSTLTVQGYIYWTDSEGATHPAENVRVYIFNDNTISTYKPPTGAIFPSVYTQTNDEGFYSYEYEAGTILPAAGVNLKITAYASGSYGEVRDFDTNSAYSQTSTDSVYANQLGITVTHNMTIPNSSNAGKAFSIYQAINMVGNYVDSLSNTSYNSVTVKFPRDDGKVSAYYDEEQIIKLNDSDAFDWDVVQHEYAHHIQFQFDITRSQGGAHSSRVNLAEVRQNKGTANYLAWGEGWATFFAISAQKYAYASTLGIPYVGDVYYTDTDSDYTICNDLENCSFGSSPTEQTLCKLGEANELVVAAVLWDVLDLSNESYDNVRLSQTKIWNIIVNNHCYTLEHFINNVNADTSISTSVKLNIGNILSEFWVSVKLYSPNMMGGIPMFTWDLQSAAPSYPNNKFRLVFYDISYNLILRTDYITYEGDSSSFSLIISASQWDTIRQSSSNVLCFVETYQSDPPESGPFYSNYIQISTN